MHYDGDDDVDAMFISTTSSVRGDGCLCRLENAVVQWTHLQLISFAIAPVVLLIVHLTKRRSGGAIANESTVQYALPKFPNTTLRYDGDDDVEAMFISTTSSADNDVTSTLSTSSSRSVLDDSWMQC